MIKADLHLHTTCSDGEYSPSQMVAVTADLGCEQISVTDHDTISGVAAAVAEGDKLGVEVIPGIEITLRFLREFFTGSLHLLVYFPRHLLENTQFTEGLHRVVSAGRGKALVQKRVERINEEFGPLGKNPLLGSLLTVESITSLAENVSRRHFAKALSSVHGLSKQQISLLIGNSSPAYVPSGVDLELVAPLIARWPVVPVLAHPAAGSFPGESHYKEVLPPFSTVKKILPEFLKAGLKGLEVYYPGHTSEHMAELLDIAREYGLAVTGGSDCHDRIERPAGTAGLSCPLDFNRLFQPV
ncbi:phosphatase [Candidatus Fermentibacteria bacterium]|nr:MAG: phosphatase [Candidatus Fermentibacteria bacterium]